MHTSLLGMIRSTPAMAVRYLKSYGFVLDLMAVLPLEVFALIWSNSDEQWSYFALLRVNRLLKLWKVCKYIQYMIVALYSMYILYM